MSHITTDTNTMSEALSEQLSLVMWYIARLIFILYFMFCQSWQISLFTCMGLPILWVIPEISGTFHQVWRGVLALYRGPWVLCFRVLFL